MKMKGHLKICAVAVLALGLGACTTKFSAPVSDRGVAPESPPASAGAETGVVGGPQMPEYYVVEAGDTLNRIAQKFGHTWQQVAAWNNMSDPNQLSVGQRIRVSEPGASSAVTITPVPTSGPVIAATPVTAPAAPATPSEPQAKSGPLARVEPYSDAAWKSATTVETPAPTPAASTPTATAKPDLSTAWIWPAGGKLLAGYSEGKTKGIDIAGNLGDDVLATAGGRVVYAGAGLRGYGKLVIIKHESDFLSAYAHNRTLMVKEGQSVTKGQKIAELGDTDADRPKLHFELRRRGKPVDPLKFLPNR